MEVDDPCSSSDSENDESAMSILNYDKIRSDLNHVQNDIKYWKQISDELRRNNYPLAAGISNTKVFPKDLRKKAQRLDNLLNRLINTNSRYDLHFHDKLRILIAQGDDYKEFLKRMKSLDFSKKCNEIWENDTVAYRCNTCALTPCMSLCESCFKSNGHAGHDYTRFFSKEGGACDCGNEDVIRPQGFCKFHGPHIVKPETNFLEVSLPEFIIVKLIVRIFLEWRGWFNRMVQNRTLSDGTFDPQFSLGHFCTREYEKVIDLVRILQEMANYGGPMREAIARILLDADLYQALTEKTGDHVVPNSPVEVNLDWRTRELFVKDRTSLDLGDDLEMFPLLQNDRGLECKTLLDELTFWIIRQNFPQPLINFALSLLSEVEYRDAFALKFFTWYPLICSVIRELCNYQKTHGRDKDYIQGTCSRVVHVSVQMLSSSTLCLQLNEKCDLVRTVYNVIRSLLCEKMKNSFLTLDQSKYFHLHHDGDPPQYYNDLKIIDINESTTIQFHGYWFVMGDMQNLLSHPSIAVRAILDKKTFEDSYVKLLLSMQGMHQVWRIVLGEHVPHDTSDPVQKAYTLEFETLSTTLFNMISGIQLENNEDAAIRFFETIFDAIERWLFCLVTGAHEVDYSKLDSRKIIACPTYVVSFHFPLHRHLSTCLSHLHDMPRLREKLASTILRNERIMRLLILHPLRIQAARSEISSSMWTRNGSEVQMMSMLYSQFNVNTSFQTPDIDLIRFCSAYCNKQWIIECFMKNFYLDEKMVFRTIANLESETLARFLGGVDEELIDYPKRDEVDEDVQKLIDILESEPEKIEFAMGFSKASENTPYSEEELAEIIEIAKSDNWICGKKVGLFQAPLNLTRDQRRELILRNRYEFGSRPSAEVRQVLDSSYVHQVPSNEPVLLRNDWMDYVLFGFLKLVAEIVVIRVNCGLSMRDYYRAEIINALTAERKTHSRLRNHISVKGSKNEEQVADFIEADQGDTSNDMNQGMYELKDEIWDREFCPIYQFMRANTMRNSTMVFAKVAKRDQKEVAKHRVYDGIPKDLDFWIPFRLISFDKNLRHEGISEIFKLLVTPEFINIAVMTVAFAHSTDEVIHFTTFQMAIYLLTLGVKYIGTLEEDDVKRELVKIYHTPFKLRTNNKIGEPVVHTICSYMVQIFEGYSRGSESYTILLRKILNGEFDLERLYGGCSIYFARFLTILAKISPACRKLLEFKLDIEERLLKKIEEENGANHQQEIKNAAKAERKKRLEAIMMQNKIKSQKTMEKLIAKEGISQDELDKMDTSQPDVKLYDCPICGDAEMPNTLQKPFGMLAYVTPNFIAHEQIDGNCERIDNILDVDRHDRDSARISWQLTTRRHFYERKRNLYSPETDRCASYRNPMDNYLYDPYSGIEIRTCGHCAHIDCFTAYWASYIDRYVLMEVGCFLCRYSINTIIPMGLDISYETRSRGAWASPESIFSTLKGCVDHAMNVAAEHANDKAYHQHYSNLSGNSALTELLEARQRTKNVLEKRALHPKEECGTSLVAMTTAHIERNCVFEKFDFPESRKNTKFLIAEHLLYAACAIYTNDENETAVNVFRDLILDSPIYTTDNVTEALAHLELPRYQEFHGLSREEVDVLMPSANKRRRVQSESCSTNVTPPSSAPLLMFDPKPMLTRLVSYIVNNGTMTKEDKMAIALILLKHVVSWVSVSSILRLLFKVGHKKLAQIRKGAYQIEGMIDVMKQMPYEVIRCLGKGKEFFKAFIENLRGNDENLEISPTPISDEILVKNVDESVGDFLRFAVELYRHVNLIRIDVHEKVVHDKNAKLLTLLGYIGIEEKWLTTSHAKIAKWIDRYEDVWNFVASYQPLLYEPVVWQPRRILKLPSNYDDLFNRYFHRACSTCSKIPNNPLVCLLCGKLVCIDECCNLQSMTTDHPSSYVIEAETHAEDCSSYTGLFLSLNSSVCIVSVGRRAGIWGSVYLDAHGEEDRNLKRGKPLRLSERRLACLERDWIELEFRPVRTWAPLQSGPLANLIRDSHLH
ncbi:unnamed protein product [Caenorhabditis bovis]|uniref:E3 ubiquitin-protein ligase n=1 Tax=Caenorhabditis bovis TaxID=2654633 RepID=A0A8S1FBA7_9PELO|nr:unnamed protein product [Caenorhabditis bovis]